MTSSNKKTITIQTRVNLPVDEVWGKWTSPEFIRKWNNASDDWHTPQASNDLTVGGRFVYRMEAKDGSFGFDYSGKYETVIKNQLVEFVLDDNRKVKVEFIIDNNYTKIVETFEAEENNSIELQQNGWQAILDNFKKVAENT